MSPVRLNGSTSGYSELSAPAVAGNITLTLPTGTGSANQFLKNGATAGSLGWSSLVEDSGGIYQYGNQYNFNSSLSTIEIVNRNSAGAKTFQWYVGASGTGPVATLTTAGVWTNASDVKNKENIEDIAYGIKTIKSLRPRQFDVKSDGSHNIGFIAQEVQPLVPEVVHESLMRETGESHLGLDYGSLTAVLTKALQEALVKIESLEARLTALEVTP